MSQLLQGNPQLWAVAGDLFIKNMDWPGAQEMAARFKKILDPKVLSEGDQSPEMMAAQQQLGLRAQRCVGLGGGHHHRLAVDGTAVVIAPAACAKPLTCAGWSSSWAQVPSCIGGRNGPHFHN